MGKTEKGTVWLDGSLTAPYEYYQYWVNSDDSDLARFLKLFTFLPLAEIAIVQSLTDARLNMAKAVLAFEATKVTHGAEAAEAAWRASLEAFHSRPVDADLFPSSSFRVPGAAKRHVRHPTPPNFARGLSCGHLDCLRLLQGRADPISLGSQTSYRSGRYLHQRPPGKIH